MPATAKGIGAEVGAGGQVIIGGILYNREDYNTDLQNQAGMLLFDKMRRSDPEISGGVFRLTAPIVSAEWQMEPAKGAKRAEEISDYVDRKLIKRTAPGYLYQSTMTDFIRQTSEQMLTFGFACWEKVWGVDADGDQVIVKLGNRHPKTVREFMFRGPEGEFSAVTQYAYSPRDNQYARREIAAEKCAVFPFGVEGDNLWGRSVLRSAYPSWDMKRKIVWIDAASLERFGMGVLEMHAMIDVSPEEKAAAEESARTFRSGENQYLYTSEKFKAEFHHPPSGQSRAIESAKYHDQQEERAMLVEFMATGTAETGSRAVVTSKVGMMLLAQQGFVKMQEENFQRQVIKEIVDRKFGLQDEYPRYVCEDISKMQGSDLVDVVAPLKEKGLIKYDRALEEFLRKVSDLPDIDDATREEGLPPTIVTDGGVPGQADNATNKGAGNAVPAVKPNAAPAVAAVVQLRELARLPVAHERFCAFSDHSRWLDEEPARIWKNVVASFRAKLSERIARSASVATDDELAKNKLPRPGLEASMAGQVADALMRSYMRGRKSILTERKRQLSGVPAVAMASQDGVDDEFDLEPTKAEVKWVGMLAKGFSALMVTGMIMEASRVGLNSRNGNRTSEQQKADVAAALLGLSEAAITSKLSGKTIQAFTNGRNEQAASMRDEITTAYYSAVMDGGTCGPCMELDGQEHDPEDPVYATPNPNCEGGDLCRCETIYVFREQSAAA